MYMKVIVRTLPLIIFLLCHQASLAQNKKSFQGLLVYKVTCDDTSMNSLYPLTHMVVYTNDTIVRMENQTASFGEQVTIRHMGLNKSYQLMTTKFGKYAIQTKLDEKQSDSVKTNDRYSFSKSKKKRKIFGKKAKSVNVSSKFYKADKTFYFLPDYENKYVNTFPEIDGLLVEYYVVTFDVILKYELIRMVEYSPNHDFFGVPEDYERISLDAFMDKMIESKSQNPENGN